MGEARARLDVRRLIGLVLGPLLFAVLVLSPPLTDPTTGKIMNPKAPWAPNAALGLLLWIIIWWFTEAVPFGLTAIMAAVVACAMVAANPKAFGYTSAKKGVYAILETYFHPVIWVFFGGFVLGYGMSTSGLAKRLSRKIVKFFGRTGDFFWVVTGMWLAVWFLSMWMSNTAATAVMYPLLLAVLVASPWLTDRQREWAMIGLAYAASLGGIATIIGTPPNLVATAFLSSAGVAEIGFVEWLQWGVPVAVVLFVILIIFGKVIFGKARIDLAVLEKEWAKEPLPPLTPEEKVYATVFAITVFLWIFRGVAKILGWKAVTIVLPHDAIPAILAAVLLFGWPRSFRPYRTYFSWKDGLSKMDWDTLMLFAGGLVVGSILFKSKAGLWLGKAVVTAFGGMSPAAICWAGILVTWLITQFASNTATTNMMAPILISLCQVAGLPNPVTAAIVCSAAVSASLAFLLPVSTPPNAIVFGSGMIRLERMAFYGIIFSAITVPIASVIMAVCAGAPIS